MPGDQAKGLRSPRECDFEGQWDSIREFPQGWGNTLGGYKQNLVHTKTQEKGAVTPQETEPDWPVSVQESPAEAWVDDSACHGVRSTEYNSPGTSPFEGGHCHYPYHSLASGQITGREHSPTHQQKTGLKIC